MPPAGALRLLLAGALFLIGGLGFAQALYWELPRTLSEGRARFPEVFSFEAGAGKDAGPASAASGKAEAQSPAATDPTAADATPAGAAPVSAVPAETVSANAPSGEAAAAPTQAGGTSLLVLWQESEAMEGAEAGRAWVMGLRLEGEAWGAPERVAGPYEFRGSEPLLYSANKARDGTLGLATAAADGAVEVRFSRDGGRSFSLAARPMPPSTPVAPRIFPSASGGWLLFVTQGKEESLSLYYARSADGESWSEFSPFVNGGDNLALNFLPVALPLHESKTDLVVFQSFLIGARSSFQLFSKVSTDGGASWTQARRVTDFLDPLARERNAPEFFDNQRASLAVVGGRIWMAWERSPLAGNPQIYVMNLDPTGAGLPATVDRASPGAGSCQDPRLLEIGGQPSVTWFDNRRGGNRVFMARRRGVDWPDEDLSGGRAEASFGRVALANGKTYAFWQGSSGGRDRIYILEPDRSAAPPSLAPLDFRLGERSRRESLTVRVDLAADSSGFEGFSYLWSRDPQAVPPRELRAFANETRIPLLADEDGPWYLAVAARDYAGNWSAPARLRYERDRTPPPGPLVEQPPTDEAGFLLSNDFTVNWSAYDLLQDRDTEDVAGYTWLLRYAGPLESPGALAAGVRRGALPPALPGLTPYESLLVSQAGPPLPPPTIMGTQRAASYVNVDNGYYLFSVAAVDRTGNIGPASTILLKADKFRPYTTVTYADVARDDFGRRSLRVFGRGFLAEGRVSRIVLDRDAREPFDAERLLQRGEYRIAGDREIDGLAFEELEPGRYRLGLFHEKRGWYWTGALLEVDENGTLKFGQAAPAYVPSWIAPPVRRNLFSLYDVMIGLALLFAVAGLVLTLVRALAVLKDGEEIRREVLALVSGGPMSVSERARSARALGRRGSGLRRRFTAVIALLVLFVVAVVSVALGAFIVRTESRNLAQGLRERAYVLLESVAQGARSYLPANNLLELGFLPEQAKAMADARYITVTGYPAEASTDPEAVWATNDPGIAGKIDGPTLRPGSSRLSDTLSPKIAAIAEELNRRAAAEVGPQSETLSALNQEGRELAARTDPASQRRFQEVATAARELERTVSERLFAIANAATSSDPPFDPDLALRSGSSYVFYKPVLYRRGTDQLFYRGMVRLEVTTDLIRAEVARARNGLIRITLIIAAAALGAGVAGAILLSSQIVRPIRNLIAAIETIRRTEDKEELASFRVEVKTQDELSTLASAANELARELVIAAKESKALEKGSDIQQLLIPLDDAGDKKLTVGRLDRPEFELYGYYKGAKRVSGDYWDFNRIDPDGKYWYFIKCDVSGKDVEAAFIMVQVVTMVINHFVEHQKVLATPGFGLDGLTYRINDFLNDRGYRGKFAAFTLGVLSARDGVLTICHAGDNLLHFWRAATGTIEVEELHSSPAAGCFPRDLVEMKGPYRSVQRRLQPGDILLLYTDGIEEAKRHFRDASFRVIQCADAPKDEPHENHTGGQDGEELGFERIRDFLGALEARGSFRLEKHHNPVPKDLLSFTFSGATGNLEERIIGLLAMEKLFRVYRHPEAGAEDEILVDKRIDAFLEKFFDQYRLVFRNREAVMQKRERRMPDGTVQTIEVEDPNYVRYRGLQEDEQYDDLTILGVRRK